jgi:hydroxymethylbilane synthase
VAILLRLGTRGSALALWQAEWVAEKIQRHAAETAVEIVVIKTTGDVRQDAALSELAGKGVFVREIEAALLRGDVDLAVHSAKDLQSTDPPGLTIAAFCERADPRDALVSRHAGLDALPAGAVVATSAPRRIAQLTHSRSDLRFVTIRGNVDTRLRKLEAGEADALILACAGLDRLGRGDVISERIPTDVCLPQVGQACVAVQCRADDTGTVALVSAACDHAPTRKCVTTERAFLSLLGGGCTAPVAAFAEASPGGGIRLSGLVATADGSRVLRVKETGTAGNAVAAKVYESLMSLGGDSILSALG